jgi:hypothetical protein
MKDKDSALETLIQLCKQLDTAEIDYRVTGLTATNLYGFGLTTNVLDIAVDSLDKVHQVINVLGLPKKSEFNSFNPYVYKISDKGYIRIQGDLMGEPVLHPLGLKLHSKELLIDRLDIYASVSGEGRIAQARAFIALTVNDETTEKYKEIWNRL